MTRDDFLSDPSVFFSTDCSDIPLEWVAEAWERHSSFRETEIYLYAQLAKEHGSLAAVLPQLRCLAEVLRDDQVTDLYLRIRVDAMFREDEFRPDFAQVFASRASALPPPLERTPGPRDEFLRRVWRDPHDLPSPLTEIPPEWLAAAWEFEDFREAHTYCMARTVSKGGELSYTDEYLAALGRSLGVERQVELFAHIRGRSPHREIEFRGRFEQFFSRSVAALPPQLTRSQVVESLGMDEESARHLIGDEPPGYE
jgi:hypothetical protein